MSAVLLTLLAALAVTGSAKVLEKAAVLKVGIGDHVAVESPDYPTIPPAGTKITWYVTGDMNSNILLTCEDLRIAPTENCIEGYLAVYDGETGEKYCGTESGLTIKSVKHEMKIQFYQNWTSGIAKCEVEGVNLKVIRKDESIKPGDGTDQPGSGTDEPGSGTDEPGSGTDEPGSGTDEPGSGTDEPGSGTDEPGSGTDEPGTGTDEPGSGTDEPGSDTDEPGTGTGQPGSGTDEPGTGTDEPGSGTDEPGSGTDQPGSGTDEPGSGTDEPGSGTDEPGSGTGQIKPGEHIIKLKLGGPAYDELYFPNIGSNQHIKWKFITTPNAKISVFCKQLILGKSCSEGKLITTGGMYPSQDCRNGRNVYVDTSRGNILGLEVVTYKLSEPGFLDCLVEAVPRKAKVDQLRPHHFQHVKSREKHDSDSKSTSDSREHGKLKKTTCKCGYSKKNRGRIVNGQVVNKGEYPWVVAIMQGGAQFCGGSIITEYHVLTAAHCTIGKQAGSLFVIAGATDNRQIKKSQVIEVKKIIDHSYDKSKFHFNDISILYLKKKIKYSNLVGPICLTPNQVPLNDKSVTVMGWGSLGPKAGWLLSSRLMKAKHRVVDYNTCSFLWYRQFDNKSQDRICAWSRDKTACFGDSGGPLVWLDPEIKRYTLIGVVSFGRGCATAVPTVYTNVAFYYNWIQQVIAATKKEKVCIKKEKNKWFF